MSVKSASLLWVGTILLWAIELHNVRAIALADEQSVETERSESGEETSREPVKDLLQARVIASHYGLPLAQVLELRQKPRDPSSSASQEEDKKQARKPKWGWGEISRALSVAKNSGQSVDAVLDLRRKRTSWGKIARQCGVSTNQIRTDVRSIDKEFKKMSDDYRQERINRTVNLVERHERRMERTR